MRAHRITSGLFLFLFVVFPPRVLSGQGTLEDYQRAATVRDQLEGLALGVPGAPTWIEDTDSFWYSLSVTGGSEFVVVDAATQQKEPAFDHTRLASGLSSASGEAYTATTLPFRTFEFVDGRRAIAADAEGSRWRCTLTDYTCTRTGEARGPGAGRGGGGGFRGGFGGGADTITAIVSPDSTQEAFIQNYDVAIRPHRRSGMGTSQAGFGGRGGAGVPERPDYTLLSYDGSEGDAYELRSIVWSPDSKKLVAYRRKPGYTRIVTYVRSSPTDQLQPLTETRNYRKPGDLLDFNQPVLFDVESGRQVIIDRALFPNPYQISRPVWWENSRGFAFEYNQRGHQVYRVLEVDGTTGAVRAIISEEVPTFFAYRNATAGLRDTGHRYVFPIDDGREVLWMSQRDNWAHLYLYDGATGEVKNQVTKGEWTVSAIDSVDVENRQIYFQALAMNPDQDPYFIHFYRINFDGSGLLEYTQGNGNHSISWSPDREYYVDSYSRVDMPPVMELHQGSDGRMIAELERGDMSAMLATGWQPPEVFVSKARDGVTDIWGLIVRPFTFDPDREYPVLEQIYAGPQGSFVPKTWGGGQNLISTAELGFIMVQIDGMGTNNRSKAFHDVAFKDLGDAGFPDRILWHKAVGEKYSWYDISRVGLYGGSAGGQNAMGGVLFHGDFYDAAFASSGCHDNRMDKIWWNEHWMSWPLGPHYEASSNAVNAHLLTGKLFLAVGEMDTNVDPSSTMQVVDALIRAGKSFELLVVPNGGHGATGLNGNRKRQDFFVKSLMGIDPPDWNSGITLGLDETGQPILLPDFDIEPPPGFFENPEEDSPFTWW